LQTSEVVAQPKVSRSTRGLDARSSVASVERWIDANLSKASATQREGLRFVAMALVKVLRHEAMAADCARAHNEMLDWVSSLPEAGGGPRPLPHDAAEIAQFPPEEHMKLHDVFSVLVGVLHRSGFTYRECGELLDDGWGGAPEARTRRAMQRAGWARKRGKVFIERTLVELVKGECRACAEHRHHPR
jgi:hypothetical protein